MKVSPITKIRQFISNLRQLENVNTIKTVDGFSVMLKRNDGKKLTVSWNLKNEAEASSVCKWIKGDFSIPEKNLKNLSYQDWVKIQNEPDIDDLSGLILSADTVDIKKTNDEVDLSAFTNKQFKSDKSEKIIAEFNETIERFAKKHKEKDVQQMSYDNNLKKILLIYGHDRKFFPNEKELFIEMIVRFIKLKAETYLSGAQINNKINIFLSTGYGAALTIISHHGSSEEYSIKYKHKDYLVICSLDNPSVNEIQIRAWVGKHVVISKIDQVTFE